MREVCVAAITARHHARLRSQQNDLGRQTKALTVQENSRCEASQRRDLACMREVSVTSITVPPRYARLRSLQNDLGRQTEGRTVKQKHAMRSTAAARLGMHLRSVRCSDYGASALRATAEPAEQLGQTNEGVNC